MVLAVVAFLGGSSGAAGVRHLLRVRHHRRVDEHIDAATSEHERQAEREAESRPPFDAHLAHLAILQRAQHSLVTGGHKLPQDLAARVRARRVSR